MPKRNSEYWQERYRILQENLLAKGDAYQERVERLYGSALEEAQKEIESFYQRFADNNGISIAEANKILNSKERKAFEMTLEEYTEKGIKNALSQEWIKELEDASDIYHISRLEKLKLQMRQHFEVLASQKQTEMEEIFEQIYQESYYLSIFELQKGLGTGHAFEILDTRRIEKVLARSYDDSGLNFSESIWKDRDALVRFLDREFTRLVVSGTTPRELIANLKKRFQTSKNSARRLVRTEVAALAAMGRKDSFDELGIAEFQNFERLDSSTCEICQDMDGSHFPQKEFEVGVTAAPFHPNCRGYQVPYFHDEFTEDEKRSAKDENGKAYFVPADMTYHEWYKKYVESNPAMKLVERKTQNKSADRKQYEEYKNVLGKDLNISFDKFQDIKYTDDEQWNYIKGLKSYMTKFPQSNKHYYNIQQELKKQKIHVGIPLPPKRLQAFLSSEAANGSTHVLNRMLERGITDDEVREYMMQAKCMFQQWGGKRFAFYGEKGVTVISEEETGWLFKTVWNRSDFDESTLKILEVIQKHVK
mgnify:FL=1